MAVATGLALGALAASAAGSGIGALASRSAANRQAQAAEQASREGVALQREMYDRDQANLQPWREAGQFGLQELLAALRPGGALTQGFQRPDFKYTLEDFQADPGYQFRMSEGLKAIQGAQGARGSVGGGAQFKDLMRFGQDFASNEFSNARNRAADEYSMAFNRFNTERQNTLAPLLSLAGLGQTATGQQLQSSQTYGTNASNLTLQGILGAANARAAGTIGMANSLAGLTNLPSSAMNIMFLQKLLQTPKPPGG